MSRVVDVVASITTVNNHVWFVLYYHVMLMNKRKKRNYYCEKSKTHGRPEYRRDTRACETIVSMLRQSKVRFSERLDPLSGKCHDPNSY